MPRKPNVKRQKPGPSKTKRNDENPQPGTSRAMQESLGAGSSRASRTRIKTVSNQNAQPVLPGRQRNDSASSDFDDLSSNLSHLSIQNSGRSPARQARDRRNIPDPPQQQPVTGAAKRKTRPKHIPPSVQEIINLQSTVANILPKLPFCRLAKEILQQQHANVNFFSRDAIDALQVSTETFMTQLLEDAYRCTLHRNRVTLHPKDIKLTRYLRGRGDLSNP